MRIMPFVEIDGVRLHTIQAGHAGRPLVVLLHGFPEFSYSWHRQISALVAAGFRVIAPDMRGYNLSDKPPRIADYRIERLADDVAGLIRACGVERASVVGHDWGAGVAWYFAMRHPQMLERLAILNVPHPVTFLRGLRSPRQMLRSWYILFFQFVGAAEALFDIAGPAILRRIFTDEPIRPGAFSQDDIARYIEAIARPGALTAAINYYRAAVRYRHRMRFARIDAPTLVIWGEQDQHLGRELAEPDRAWVPNCRVERIADASHWVQMDRPERVNELLGEFLGG